MSEGIIVALIAGAASVGGAGIGAYFANKKSTALIAYRLEQLEAKVDKHNHFAQRVPVIEEQMKAANHRIEDLERKVDT